jgi:hypothetical protein
MTNTSIASLIELRQQLLQLTVHEHKKVFVGFDGFVDRIKKAVRQKGDRERTYYKTLLEFADRVKEASGRSGQVELITQKTKLGGNAPILCDGLGKLGIHNYCLGSMGYPKLHPLFYDLNKNCEPISVLDPGESDALEFEDGKIILSELSVFDDYDWKYIVRTVGLPKIQKTIEQCGLLAFVDWVNLPHSSDIWEGMLKDVIKPSARRDFMFLFDLCDPSKKSTQEIDEILDAIGCFSSYGKVTLGLNENETFRIWSALNGCVATETLPSIEEAADYLHRMMNIDCLLIHPVDRTIAFHQREIFDMPGRFVTNPKVLTGGGDNLNAGYCLGLLAGFSLPQCILLGMAASGAYIENGVSPDKYDLMRYIDTWITHLSKESSISKDKIQVR